MQPQPNLVVQHSTGQYPIYIRHQWQEQIAEIIGREFPNSLIVSDETVADLYASAFHERLVGQGHKTRLLTVPAGENSKSLTIANNLYERFLEAGLDRHSTIIAFGGGVVGDLAGFVAATWMRGIDFVQVPTTLLAQVDSSVGGKTGINLPAAKNSIGAFWQPGSVFIDTDLLKTLSDDQYTSGLAEVVKYGVILDEPFFAMLENNIGPINGRDAAILAEIVQRCCELKAQVVKQDERETTGQRAILNYGHTFGHAIETVTGFGAIPHGHAVAMGMQVAARLAESLEMVGPDFLRRQQALLTALNIPCCMPGDRHEEMIMVMRTDKKAVDGLPRFVLPTRIGRVELSDHIDPEQVAQVMRESAGDS